MSWFLPMKIHTLTYSILGKKEICIVQPRKVNNSSVYRYLDKHSNHSNYCCTIFVHKEYIGGPNKHTFRLCVSFPKIASCIRSVLLLNRFITEPLMAAYGRFCCIIWVQIEMEPLTICLYLYAKQTILLCQNYPWVAIRGSVINLFRRSGADATCNLCSFPLMRLPSTVIDFVFVMSPNPAIYR